jgi:hypothetical protein
MKITKLNGTHRLFYQGYTHGLRYDRMSLEVRDLIHKLKDQYGDDGSKWRQYRSRKGRPLWIGFKDPKIISFVLML